MSRIHRLDPLTVAGIAAGEVIERPASVVKEFVENALDAGATQIRIELEDGGRRLIRVTDNGCGISREDAPLAFERHATSKLQILDDLDHLSTLGFRGEALASMAVVARVRLVTRERDTIAGTAVEAAGGKVVKVEPVGCPEGTSVAVHDLFADLPARRKHLRSARTELARCVEVGAPYGLTREGLLLELRHGGQPLLQVDARTLRDAFGALVGRRVAERAIAFDQTRRHTRIRGLIGRLEDTRSAATHLYLLVNGRPVRAPRLVSAVVEGFGTRLMKDRWPVGVIAVETDPATLDVNIHPTKREVRFEDEGLVRSLLRETVESALSEADLTTQFAFSPQGELVDARLQHAEPTAPAAPGELLTRSEQLIASVVQEAFAEAPAPARRAAPRPRQLRALAQVLGTYIVAEGERGLCLIDQHAASERVHYEALRAAIAKGQGASQQALLSPLPLHLSPSEHRALQENEALFRELGFSFEPLGGTSVAVRTLPVVAGTLQAEGTLHELLDRLSEDRPRKPLGEEAVWLVACHAAIRAGEPLSTGQMQELLDALLRTDAPQTCEHGRPTMVELSAADLERLFKRRG